VAIAAVITAISALTALVIVATSSQALETLAIILAVVAFVSQLIIFIFQTIAASQQVRQAASLHADLTALVAQIAERTQGTQATVSTINERLLEAAIGKAIPSTPNEVTSPEFRRNVAENVSAILAAEDHDRRLECPPPDLVTFPRREKSSRDAELLRMMSTFPPPGDEAEQAIEALLALPPDARLALRRFARDERQYRVPNTTLAPGILFGAQEDEALRAAGLVGVDSELRPGWPIGVLTDKGRRVGRLLTADGSLPAHLKPAQELLAELRSTAE
jgi:hypothetical protein